MRSNILFVVALCAALLYISIGCHSRVKESEILSVNQVLSNPIKYLGKEIHIQGRVIFGEALLGTFYVEDIDTEPDDYPRLRLAVNYRGKLPSEGEEVEIIGRLTIIGMEYIVSAIKIEYLK